MKKMFLVLFMILALTGIAFADQPSGGGDATATATATQSQGIGSGNILNGQGGTISILSPSATGGVGGAGGAGGSVTNTQVGGTFAPTVNVNPTIKPEINTNIGNGIGNFSPKATIEKGAVDIDNKNINVNKNTNIGINKQGQKQGQSQGQDQGQFQGQNNDQTIAPHQEINIEAPKRVAVGTAPQDSGQSELNFISPNERDVTTTLPSFGCGTIKKLTAKDCIVVCCMAIQRYQV